MIDKPTNLDLKIQLEGSTLCTFKHDRQTYKFGPQNPTRTYFCKRLLGLIFNISHLIHFVSGLLFDIYVGDLSDSCALKYFVYYLIKSAYAYNKISNNRPDPKLIFFHLQHDHT